MCLVQASIRRDNRTEMAYLLDSNVLIYAKDNCSSVNQFERYRRWIVDNAHQGRIFVPIQIFGEISRKNDDLKRWISQRDIRNCLVFDEEVSQECVDRVLHEGYGENLLEHEVARIGKDAHLIAYAVQRDDLVIVTKETSEPNRERSNRKIPDVCAMFEICCIDDCALYRRLEFDPFSV